MSWHEGERATVIGGLVLAGVFLALYIALVPSLWDFSTLRTSTGLPLAADFSNFWAASKLALSGKPALAYNIYDLHELELQFLGSTHRHLSGFYYPPVFLLMVLPLGLLPYLLSFSIWIGVTLLLYMIVLSKISPHKILLPLMLLFPGIYENFIYGQNAFLSGFLLGGGLLLLDSSPLLAGCLIGFLCYKPQFIMLVLFALLVGRFWKALIAALATSLILICASYIAFGHEVWRTYFAVMSIPMKLLEIGWAPWSIMPTFFAATLSAGFDVKAAYLVQGMVMLVVIGGVAWVWMSKTSLALRGSVLTLGLLLFTPYAFVHELALMALPLGWLWEDGRVRGRLPGELMLLLFGWLMPFTVSLIWDSVNILHGKLQIGPEVLLALFLFALIKAKMRPLTSRKISPEASQA
ncbi:MAG: glycosyltransferase family 87 protein [Desulfobaccales bacterium]